MQLWMWGWPKEKQSEAAEVAAVEVAEAEVVEAEVAVAEAVAAAGWRR